MSMKEKAEHAFKKLHLFQTPTHFAIALQRAFESSSTDCYVFDFSTRQFKEAAGKDYCGGSLCVGEKLYYAGGTEDWGKEFQRVYHSYFRVATINPDLTLIHTELANLPLPTGRVCLHWVCKGKILAYIKDTFYLYSEDKWVKFAVTPFTSLITGRRGVVVNGHRLYFMAHKNEPAEYLVCRLDLCDPEAAIEAYAKTNALHTFIEEAVSPFDIMACNGIKIDLVKGKVLPTNGQWIHGIDAIIRKGFIYSLKSKKLIAISLKNFQEIYSYNQH
eukprot:TRINITY_DN1652_c0_g1_i1.p1 TRINITY_DN1652_c0_g1~~TRINITY_DN1652_c0_g1_i1.p1  ORF type:complete len:274 (+),score=8.62 TRINITY_DN1652_c0_g1_i1:147-968(+)